MSIAKDLISIHQEVVSLKTQQRSGGDSAILYMATFESGVVSRNTLHRIKCITEVPLEQAIFMASYQQPLSVQFIQSDYLPLQDLSDEVVWLQQPPTEVIGDDSSVFAPKSIIIYSNVPFVIKVTSTIL